MKNNKQIRVGIYGYGNIGKASEWVLTNLHSDLKLEVIFSRRDVEAKSGIEVVSSDKVLEWKDKLDILLLCNGSKDDLPVDGPFLAEYFNTVDSYDNHSDMLEYYDKMNNSASLGGKLAIFGAGWDPGKFSKERIEASAYYPDGSVTSFWGKGVSQGHTNAIKEFNKTTGKNWVADAIQYTHPIDEAVEAARIGKAGNLASRDKHWRECFVALTEEAQNDSSMTIISDWIKSMPGYYEPYNTIVNFVSLNEILEMKEKMYHAGKVISHGITSTGGNQKSEYWVDIDSNPEHTARILVAHARANYRIAKEGTTGAIPAICVPVDKLHHNDIKELIKNYV